MSFYRQIKNVINNNDFFYLRKKFENDSDNNRYNNDYSNININKDLREKEDIFPFEKYSFVNKLLFFELDDCKYK